MQGTRDRILAYIVEHRGARAETLAEVFDISAAAVRRHLDNLRADGLVEARTVKQATGRPYYAYFPTEKAFGTIPPAYADLMARMLRGLEQRPDVVAEVLADVAESLASRHRDEIPDGAAVEEIVARVTEVLRREGILEEWRLEADGIHLVNTSCPYHVAAQISDLPCEADRKAIELLLGRDVEQLHRIVDGAPCCEYLVRPTPGQRQIIETVDLR
ncbi:helix-turn-helix transcriptional regulator [Tepidiforma thermophila]|uniref:Transcriptional regulator n=1 Tax=Tepidiforma thermophila (strain KCTC 52669 / CGMCC 1.13589 / G233) TaxID=2761530 RepID=A0A2A9HDT8_TEPT2|nr:helix-turn-helix domain-containing protein [Tepidiforma thermophila]PFG74187.1 transcriptional regulator [Tepidiforma thermophila]